MGRHTKNVLNEGGIDRRETGYYSTPAFVAEYLHTSLLRLRPNARSVYDPCVGHGELLIPFEGDRLSRIGSDIIPFERGSSYEFSCFDFLKEAARQINEPLYGSKIPKSDIIVANPPYNCHEHEYLRQNKQYFVKTFGKSAFLNFYSLFLTAIIRTAQEGAAIGIITLDSFLTARGHEELRKLILQECIVHEILLCPTDLFRSQGADVRTCILIIEKGKSKLSSIKTLNRPVSSSDFRDALISRDFDSVPNEELILRSDKDRGEFLIGVPIGVLNLFEFGRLGERFCCKTGISTGDDKKYLRKEPEPGFSVPFYKNPGNRRFYTEPDAYLCDEYSEVETQVSNFMVRNRRYIGRKGITCSSMGVSFGAAIMPKGGTFGVNANVFAEEEDLWWLLSYLNSSLCNYLIRGVLLRSNMITAGYVSRLPVPCFPPATRGALEKIGLDAYEARPSAGEAQLYIRAIDRIVFDALGMEDGDREEIEQFCSDIIRRT